MKQTLMKQTFLTVWLSGVMMGTGAGIILARSLTWSHADASQVSLKAEERSYPQGTSTLFDPRQPLPAHLPEGTVPAGEVEAQKASTPSEPRRFPEVEASPVTQRSESDQSDSPVAEVNTLMSEEASEPAAQPAREFREELEKIAPGFSVEALEELERIRAVVETTPVKTKTEETPSELKTVEPSDSEVILIEQEEQKP